MVIDLAVPCADWQETAEIKTFVKKSARQAISAVMANAGSDIEVSIVLGSDEMVQSLNRQYNNKDKPTNVLSFPSGEELSHELGPKILGDVILARETVKAEARAQGKSIVHHACHLTIHGILHLLGHMHDDNSEADAMEKLEISILASLGMPNPYLINDDIHKKGEAG